MSAGVVLLLFLVGCAMAGNGLIVPVLPHFGEVFSASATAVGMLITLFGVARLMSNMPTGLAYDRLGPRTLMMAGNGMLLAGAVGAALSDTMAALLGFRILQGVGSGVFLTTAGIALARISVPGSRGRLMAAYQGAIFTGAGIGPVAGGLLADGWGIRAPFWAYAACAAIAVVAALRMPGADAGTDPDRRRPAKAVRGLLEETRFIANLAMALSSGFVRTAALWQIVPLVAANRYGMGFDRIGLAITMTAVANVVILPLSGWLVDRFGTRFLSPLSAVALALSLLLIGYGQSEAGFWIGVVGAGLAGGLNGPSLSAALIDMTPPELLGAATGAQRTATDVGFISGPIVIGLLSDHLALGHAEAMLFTSGLLVVAAAIWIVCGRRG